MLPLHETHLGKRGEATTLLSIGLKQSQRQKHSRQRSSSWQPPVTANPNLNHNEALASLISSLSSISQTQGTEQRPQTSIAQPQDLRRLSRSVLPELPRTLSSFGEITFDGEDEYDACPEPVAGYNTISAGKPIPRPKTSSGNPSSFKQKLKRVQNQASQRPGSSKGAKGRRDLNTPDSYLSSIPRTSHGDESIYSVALSTSSKFSARKTSLKMFFSTRVGSHEYHQQDQQHSFDTARSSPDKDITAKGFSAFVAVQNIPTDDRENAETRTLSSLSPSLRTDLGENIIPSRRSSLRSGSRRHSTKTSRDLMSLNIDQDLIEENSETVQRIRELQEAKEKRQHEWRKEAKRSERAAAKRNSLPHSTSPRKSSSSVRTSWHPTVVTTPEVDDTEASEQKQLHIRPYEPLTPIEQEATRFGSFDLNRPTTSRSGSMSLQGSPLRHRKKLSDSIRRVSLRSPIPDDARGIAEEVEAYLGAPRMTQKIRHPRTGRTIAFSEVGDPDGFVVICCVGMGLTRYVSSFYDDIARSHKLRIITPDRPGVGETEPLPPDRAAPLSWVDDVAVICTNLGIEKFSLLAHSAGAIYALATALKMPQYVRGRIHLLGPWIPQSVLQASEQFGNVKPVNLPTAHKLLSILPASFMKAANSRFLSATSASLEPKTIKNRKKDRAADLVLEDEIYAQGASLSTADFAQGNILPSEKFEMPQYTGLQSPPQSPQFRSQTLSPIPSHSNSRAPSRAPTPLLTSEERQRLYNTTLAHRTWALATLNANPAVDLIICLERKKPIGFRYTDITRAVVIHHGANDTRVPLDNVRWLSTAMKRCELRVLENEGHGLMASASVMANVLAEVAKEWEEWHVIVNEKEKEKKKREEAEAVLAKEKERAFRRGHPRW